jgi:hypothetical protein
MNRRALFAAVILAIAIPGPLKAQNALQEADLIEGELSFILSSSVVQSGYALETARINLGNLGDNRSWQNIAEYSLARAGEGLNSWHLAVPKNSPKKVDVSISGFLRKRSTGELKSLRIIFEDQDISDPGKILSYKVKIISGNPDVAAVPQGYSLGWAGIAAVNGETTAGSVYLDVSSGAKSYAWQMAIPADTPGRLDFNTSLIINGPLSPATFAQAFQDISLDTSIDFSIGAKILSGFLSVKIPQGFTLNTEHMLFTSVPREILNAPIRLEGGQNGFFSWQILVPGNLNKIDLKLEYLGLKNSAGNDAWFSKDFSVAVSSSFVPLNINFYAISGYIDDNGNRVGVYIRDSYNNIVNWDTVPALAGTEAFGVIRMDYNNYRYVTGSLMLTAPADPLSEPLLMDDSGIKSGTGQFNFRAPAYDAKAVCNFQKLSGSGAVRQGVGAVTGP